MRFLLRGLFVISFAVLFFSCGQRGSEENQSIFFDSTVRAMYDARVNGDYAYIESFSDSDQATYRALYAKLMGSIIPESAPEDLEKLLRDPIPYVRLYVAFAVGQIGDENSLPSLDKAFKKATIPEIKAELLEAIGKCADENAMRFLVEHNPNTAIEESGKMWGVYRGMLKGELKEKHLGVVVAHLASSEDETRLAAAHVLSRQQEFELDDFTKEILEFALKEKSPDVKAALGKALVGSKEVKSFCQNVLELDDHVLTRSTALAIAPESDEYIQVYEDALLGGIPLETMVAVKKLSGISNYTPPLTVINAARSSSIPEFKAFIAAKLLDSDSEEGRRFYREAWNSFSNPVKRALMLSVWSQFPSGLDTLRGYLFQDNVLGSTATMAYLTGANEFPFWSDSLRRFALQSFENGLLAQSCLYADFLTSTKDSTIIAEAELVASLEKFKSPHQVEAYKTISKAISVNYGTDIPAPDLSYTQINWETLQNLKENSTLTIYTGGNEYEIKLVPEDAPASCSYVIEYAKAGRYDGTYFHRIVPGFVSQGGGPRGDGYGSGEELLRSEFSSLKYGKGVVGLASAGKDTESCQFFITHTSTPHLDGHYTIIGATVDQIHTIETGAKIDSVRLN